MITLFPLNSFLKSVWSTYQQGIILKPYLKEMSFGKFSYNSRQNAYLGFSVSILSIEPMEKQNLLEIANTDARLSLEIKILGREIQLLNTPKGPIQKLPWGGEVNLN